MREGASEGCLSDHSIAKLTRTPQHQGIDVRNRTPLRLSAVFLSLPLSERFFFSFSTLCSFTRLAIASLAPNPIMLVVKCDKPPNIYRNSHKKASSLWYSIIKEIKPEANNSNHFIYLHQLNYLVNDAAWDNWRFCSLHKFDILRIGHYIRQHKQL